MRKKEHKRDKQIAESHLGDLNSNVMVVIVNVNRLNTQIKRQRLSDWTFK